MSAMQRHGTPITSDKLAAIVAEDEKQRYQFSEDKRRIRASQGHSVDVDLGYPAQEPPDVLYHGTAERFLESIRKAGLEKRARHHVHLSATPNTAVKVGKRYGRPVILSIAAGRMHRAGHQFYCSDNNVWLTDQVPVEYITFPSD
jgi:putative RNA 2'-phosphotransferase